MLLMGLLDRTSGAQAMNINLASKLMEKNVLGVNTEVEAEYTTKALGGHINMKAREVFLITQVLQDPTNNRVIFEMTSTRNGSKRHLGPESIIAIDGMDPSRFASVYNVKADGADAKVGKRRGRKPKDRSKVDA